MPAPASWGASAPDAPGSRDAAVQEGMPDAGGAALPVDVHTSMERHQRQRMEASLARHHNNRAPAAREPGLHRANLVRLAKRLGLREDALSPPGSRPRPGAANAPQ